MTADALLRRRSSWLAALGIAVAALAIATWAWSSGGASHDASSLPPFYLEATLDMEDASRSIGTQPAGAAPATIHRRTQVRWLQNSRDEARVELETLEPAAEAGTDLIVYDGKDQWYYRHETNTYVRSPIPPVPDGVTMRVRPWSFAAFIGPWYGAAKTVDEFMAELRTMSNNSTDVRRTGTGTVLGRTVAIVEQSPTSTSSSSDGETRHGTARYWVDEEHMVVLRQEVDDRPTVHFTIEVTHLEWNPKGRGRVTFTPPPNARREQENNADSTTITPTSR